MKDNDIILNGKVYQLVSSHNPTNRNPCSGCAFDKNYKECSDANDIQSCDSSTIYILKSQTMEQQKSKEKFFIIRNMSTGWCDYLIDTPEAVEAGAKAYAAKEPGTEFWVYEKQYIVKAQVPVVVIKD